MNLQNFSKCGHPHFTTPRSPHPRLAIKIFKQLLKLARRTSENTFPFSLTIFVGVPVSWYALEACKIEISLSIFSLFIFETENWCLGCLLHASAIANCWDGSYILHLQ